MVVAEPDRHGLVVPVHQRVVAAGLEQAVLREARLLDNLLRRSEITSRPSVFIRILSSQSLQRVLNAGKGVRMNLAAVRNIVRLRFKGYSKRFAIIHYLLDRLDWLSFLPDCLSSLII